MASNDSELRCIGCGAIIQTSDKHAAGYTPASALAKGQKTGELYCQRCFRLRHYNEIAPVTITDDDFLRLLNQLQNTDALIVYVVDVFDVNGSLIPGLQRFVGNNQILLVGNKEDLLPHSLRRSKLRDWLRQRVNAAGLRPIATVLVSAKRNHAINDLLGAVEKYRQGRDVYVVGVTNVGKSTLINAILEERAGVANLITTSRFPGTTLDRIEIPLDDGKELIDTPGIIHREQLATVLDPEDLKIVAPSREIKPRTYQLNPQQTLFLGAVARFDFETGPRQGMVAYFENNLPIHRTKLANAKRFYAKHAGELLTPPTADRLKDLPPLKRYEFKVQAKSDIVFEGLGWIKIPKPSTVAAWMPEGTAALVRPAMI